MALEDIALVQDTKVDNRSLPPNVWKEYSPDPMSTAATRVTVYHRSHVLQAIILQLMQLEVNPEYTDGCNLIYTAGVSMIMYKAICAVSRDLCVGSTILCHQAKRIQFGPYKTLEFLPFNSCSSCKSKQIFQA